MKAKELLGVIGEAKVTTGMKNAMSKLDQSGYKCRKCNTSIPRYTGRYPGKCPDCGTPLYILSKAEELLDFVNECKIPPQFLSKKKKSKKK